MTTQNETHDPIMNKKNFIISIAIMGGLFFTFGFVSWVNAILIPYFRISCELTHFQSYLVTFAFYIAYFVMAIPASMLLNKFGFKKGMMYGLWAMALGALHVHTACSLPVFLLSVPDWPFYKRQLIPM